MPSDIFIFRGALVFTLLLTAVMILRREVKLNVAVGMHGLEKRVDEQGDKHVLVDGQEVDGKEMFMWMAPFDGSGFGSEAANILQALVTQGKLDPGNLWIDATQDKSSGCDSLVVSEAQRAILQPAMQKWRDWRSQHDHGAIGVVVCHSLPPFWVTSHGDASEWSSCAPCPPIGSQVGVRIGRAMVETDRYHEKFVKMASDMDEIWVPSQFSRDVLASSGLDRAKIKLIPIPIDTNRFNPQSVEPARLPMGEPLLTTSETQGYKLRGSASATAGHDLVDKGRPFVFLSTFKWEPRKGWDTLIEAFVSAFKASDNVALYILTKPSGGQGLADIRNQVKDHFKSIKKHLKVKVLPVIQVIVSRLSSEDYVRVYKAADCYVTASRGEGWGMPITEAMSMGLPIISTNWSGSADIINTSYAWPISYTLEPVERPANDPVWWFEDSKWARANVTELAEEMKYAFLHQEECREKGKIARRVAEEKYSIAAVASVIDPELDRVRKVGRAKKFEAERVMKSHNEAKIDSWHELEIKEARQLEGWRENGYKGFEEDYFEKYEAYFNQKLKAPDSLNDKLKASVTRLSQSLDSSRVNEVLKRNGYYDDDHIDWKDEGKGKGGGEEGIDLFTFPPGFQEKLDGDRWGSDMIEM